MKSEIKTEAHPHREGWTLTTWCEGRFWLYEITGPKGASWGRGFYNAQEARTRALQAISLTA